MSPALAMRPCARGRTILWRRVYVRLAYLGLTTGDLLVALRGESYAPADRTWLYRLLDGQRVEPPEWRATVAAALGLPPVALDDDAEWEALVG